MYVSACVLHMYTCVCGRGERVYSITITKYHCISMDYEYEYAYVYVYRCVSHSVIVLVFFFLKV